LRVRRLPAFVDDLSEAYAYLADRSPAAAERLLDEVDAVAELLALFPSSGRQRSELGAGLRSRRLRRFPHLVFYRQASDAILLLRLLHGARNLENALEGAGQAAPEEVERREIGAAEDPSKR
jgi:toxin ParE1/3/4